MLWILRSGNDPQEVDSPVNCASPSAAKVSIGLPVFNGEQYLGAEPGLDPVADLRKF